MLNINKFKMISTAAVAVLCVGVGVSYAAKDALPDESLYALKRNINEGVRELLAISPKQEARLHVELASERINETERLASRGVIPEGTAARLKADFKRHAYVVDSRVSQLKSDDKQELALEVTSKFESSLKAHESVLADFEDENIVVEIIESVETQISAAEDSRADAESEIKAKARQDKKAAKTKMRYADSKIDEVSDLIKKFTDKIGVEYILATEARLDKAEVTYRTAKERYDNEIYSDAFIFFEMAGSQAVEAGIYLETKKQLSVKDKSDNGSGDTATTTPITPTLPDVNQDINATTTATTTSSTSSTETATSTIGSGDPEVITAE